jgi:hypothetical protein
VKNSLVNLVRVQGLLEIMIKFLIVSVNQLRAEEIVALWWTLYQVIRDQFIEVCLESLSNILISFQVFYYENF